MLFVKYIYMRMRMYSYVIIYLGDIVVTF